MSVLCLTSIVVYFFKTFTLFSYRTDYYPIPLRLRPTTLKDFEIDAVNSGGGSSFDNSTWKWSTRIDRKLVKRDHKVKK